MSRAHQTRSVALSWTLLALAGPASAWAQSGEAPSGEQGEIARPEGDVLRPGQGRVPVAFEAVRGGDFDVALAPGRPAEAQAEAEFENVPFQRFCRSPCTLYLRPGAHRLIGEPGRSLSWRSDFMVPEGAAARAQVRGHLVGLTALGGALFIVGAAAALAGPGVLIATDVATDRAIEPELIAAGILSGLAGAASVLGGYLLVRFAMPRVDVLRAPASSARAQGIHWAPSVGATPHGAVLQARFEF